MEDLIEKIGDILPVIIFIIIMIITSIGKKKKDGEGDEAQPPSPAPSNRPAPARQHAQQPPQSSQREYREDHGDSEQGVEEEPVDVDLRTVLEDIFLPVSMPKKHPPKKHRHVQPAPAVPRRNAESEWERSIAERKAKDEAKARAKALAKEERYAASLAPCDVHQQSDDTATSGAPFISGDDTLAAQARKGFVWSEVLGTPVGMR